MKASGYSKQSIYPQSALLEKEENKPASSSFIGSIKLILAYLFADLKKKQRSFRIGLITIIIVTTFVTLLMSGIIISPLIFLRLSESDVGEIDAVLNPSIGTNRTFLNLPNLAMYNFY